MATNRNAKKPRRRAKKKTPLPGYYITTGRTQSGLPVIKPQSVQKKSAQPAPQPTRKPSPSRPKKPCKIYKAKRHLLDLFVVLGYSVLPALTTIKVLPIADWRYLAGGLILIWMITWHLYASDKKSAKSGSWRIPENTLHFIELIGGWPAAYLAQQRFRHKTRKNSYQFTFWAIGILHQALCFIYLNNPQAFANLLKTATER